MCGHCSDDEMERRKAERFDEYIAEQLERLAYAHRQLAYRNMKPHSEEAKRTAEGARALIKLLVNQWL